MGAGDVPFPGAFSDVALFWRWPGKCATRGTPARFAICLPMGRQPLRQAVYLPGFRLRANGGFPGNLPGAGISRGIRREKDAVSKKFGAGGEGAWSFPATQQPGVLYIGKHALMVMCS